MLFHLPTGAGCTILKKITLMRNLLTYCIFDTLALLFSIVLAMTVGNPFQPNIAVFVAVLLLTRFLFYWLWLHSIKRSGFPIFRLLIHTIILLVTIPILISAGAFVFPSLSNNIFWFGLVPFIAFCTSLALHRFYQLKTG